MAQTSEYELAAKEAFAAPENGTDLSGLEPLGVRLLNEFAQARLDRRQIEERWMRDLRQYKGQYDPEVLALIGPNRSKAFTRKTRVKVKTVDARMLDLLFPANQDRNWSVEPTPVPSIPRETRQVLEQVLTQALQRKPTQDELRTVIADYVKKSSTKMGQTIDDQLTEARYRAVAKEVIHSGNLYGAGILKGPLVERKVRISYIKRGNKWESRTESYTLPFVDHVPLWRFYPDMNATCIENARYAYENHALTRAAMLELAERPRFDTQAIIDYVMTHPHGLHQEQWHDIELRLVGDRQALRTDRSGLYDVLERWGWVTAEDLEAVGVKIPAKRRHESFFAQIWILPNGRVIKASLQPVAGETFPYRFFYFDKDETSIFGEGVAAVMRDDQEMLNAGTRLMLDNAAISGGPQYEVNVRAMSSKEKLTETFPHKVWLRNGEDAQYPAVRILDVPSHVTELASIVEMFESNADETTAIPRYMTGENVNSGAAGTASGMSMLMGAAGIVLKDLVVNYDEGVTRPFITALYRWNMRFNPDDAIKGDYDVKARGAASLVAKEVRAQTLAQFAMSLQPEERPFVKWDALARARAEAQDLGNVLKTEDEVKSDQNSPQNQMAQQLAEEQAKLEMAKLAGAVAELQAKVAKLHAEAVDTNVRAAYAAMQAGAVATQSPHVAPAGDAILRSAGWQDSTPQEGTPAGAEGQPVDANVQPVPPEMQSPEAGAMPQQTPGMGQGQGIETADTADNLVTQ